jgi:osmotically-inducible protein OsmY
MLIEISHSKKALILVIWLQLVFLAASPHVWAQTPVRSAKNSADAALQRTIEEKFKKSRISVNKFQVRVEGGVATIEGTTDVIQHKGTATRLARSAGAKSVVNKVKIGEAARKKAVERLTLRKEP